MRCHRRTPDRPARMDWWPWLYVVWARRRARRAAGGIS